MRKIERALVVRAPYIGQILSGRKSWEIRGSGTKVKGLIGLIEAGSGHVVGCCELVGVRGPLTLNDFRANASKIGVSAAEIKSLPYKRRTHAWMLRRAQRFRKPRPYEHPSGAVRWVKILMRG